MGSDEAEPSKRVTISAKAAKAAKEDNRSRTAAPEDNGGWEAEAESIVDEEEGNEAEPLDPEREAESEGATEDEDIQEGQAETEVEEDEPDEAEGGDDDPGPHIYIAPIDEEEDGDDEPAAATLVVGAARAYEDDDDDEIADEGSSDDDEAADEELEDAEAVDEDVGSQESGASPSAEEEIKRQRRPYPAFLIDEHGLPDKRIIGAIAMVLVLIVAAGLIYIVLNKPGELTVPYEQLGDRVTYQVNGNAYFKLHQGDISIPMLEGSSIDESNIDFSGTLTLGTNASFETIKDGFYNDHTTFARRMVQDLDIDGESRRDDRAFIPWPPTYERSVQYSYVDSTSLLTIKLISEHNLSYDLAKENLDWVMAKGVVYVQYSSFSVFIPNPVMYNGPEMKEGECGTYVPDEINSEALRWCIKEGEDILGNPTLRIDIEPATLPDGITVSKISLWLSEISAYPLKIALNVDAALTFPLVGQLADGKFRYTAVATDIKHGSGDVPSGTPKLPAVDQKHKLAQQQGQFMAWSKNGAPQLGVPPEYSGLDPDFDIQEAVNVINGSDANVTDYLDNKPGHYVLDASYGIEGGKQAWDFTIGYHKTINNNDINAYLATVTKNGTGNVVVEQLTKNETSNPNLDRTSITDLLTLGGAELVLASDDHVAGWAMIGSGDEAAFDYSKETLYLKENPATPVANLGSLGSSFSTLNLVGLANSFVDGDMDLNDIIGELSEGQGGYGYVLTREKNNGIFTAVVDAGSGGLLGIGIVKQSEVQ